MRLSFFFELELILIFFLPTLIAVNWYSRPSQEIQVTPNQKLG